MSDTVAIAAPLVEQAISGIGHLTHFGAFGLVAWLVKRTFGHTIPRLQSGFAETLREQRQEFLQELREIRESMREERHECLQKVEELRREVVVLGAKIRD